METKEEVNIKDEKKKIYKNILKMFAVVGLVFFALIGYGVYWAFFDMNRLPTGEYLTEEISPDGKYTLKAYVTNGGLQCHMLFVVSWSLIKEIIKRKIFIGIIERNLQISLGLIMIQ